MASQLSSALEQAVDTHRLPAVGAVVVDKSGKQIYNQAFGKVDANDSSSTPFTNDTELIIFSCTKLLTSLAAVQLLEKGQLSLDDPVAKYLPSEADVKVCTGVDNDGKPVFRDQKGTMTVLHLITHTAGYSYDFWDEKLKDSRLSKSQPVGAYLNVGAAWQFDEQWLNFDPGQHYEYGINIDKLGFIVEKVSGVSLPEYIKQNITDPLGMTSTGPKLNENNYLKVHAKDGEGKLTAIDAVKPATNPEFYGGGHYLVSTVNDYTKLLLTLLNDGTNPQNGGTILKPESVQNYVFKDMIPAVGCTSDGIGKIPLSVTPGTSNSGEFLAGVPKGWSCGLMLNMADSPGGRKANSGAWAGLGNLFYWIDRSHGIAGMFGTSILPFYDADSVALFEKVEKFAYEGGDVPAPVATG